MNFLAIVVGSGNEVKHIRLRYTVRYDAGKVVGETTEAWPLNLGSITAERVGGLLIDNQ